MTLGVASTSAALGTGADHDGQGPKRANHVCSLPPAPMPGERVPGRCGRGKAGKSETTASPTMELLWPGTELGDADYWLRS